jgi:hypothetical protein
LVRVLRKWFTTAAPILRVQRKYSLVHDDTNGIVEQTLAKDNGVQFGIDLVLIEDGEDGDGICGGQGGAEDETLYQP